MLLQLYKNNKPVKPVVAGLSFGLDDGSVVSPAILGWTQGDYALGPYMEAPPPPTPLENLSSDMRSVRDRKLSECDWTQLADAPVDRAAWAAYRQALREVPQQPGFPETITWPAPPKG